MDNSVGGSLYNDVQSSNLAWGESYISDSYLDVYAVTKNTAWLDKFITHTDGVISNANDYDGDGYLGWETYTYSEPILENGGFETSVAGDALTPANWARFQGTSSNLYRYVSPTPYAGSGALFTKSRTDGMWTWMTQTITSYIPGVRYNFRFQAKVGAASYTGRAWIRDETTSTILASVVVNGNTSWDFFSADFTTPAAGHTLKVYLGLDNLTANQTAYWDEVNVNPWFGYMVHDGKIGVPIAKFVRMVYENPAAFPVGSTYRTKADSYKSFIENNLLQRWESGSFYGNTWVNVSSTEGYYKFPSTKDTYTGSTPGQILPYNMMLTFAEMLLHMYSVDGNATYLDRAKKIIQYWKSRITLNGTAYEWNYWNTTGSAAEDTSHGMLDLGAALTAFNDGQIMNGTDMGRFTNTFTNVMWHPSSSPPYVSYRVDGSGTNGKTRDLVNWIELSAYNWDAWWIGADQYRTSSVSSGYHMNVLGQIMKWDPQKIVNQGFELKSNTDSTMPARWNRGTGATSASVFIDSSQHYEGDYSGAVIANGSATNTLYETQQDWSTSTSYTLEFYGKTDGSAAGGRVEVVDATTSAVLGYVEFTSTSWTPYSFTFTSPSVAADTLRTVIKNKVTTATSGKASVDNIKIRKTSDAW